MRGLLKAVLVLAPVLAGAAPKESEAGVSTAYITPTLGRTGGRQLNFRFDVRESEEACGDAHVSINGKKLSSDGHGSLTLDNGDIVDAKWNFSCVLRDDQPREQLMNLYIDSVNTQAVSGPGIAIRFQQVAPVRIYDVDGPATMVSGFRVGAKVTEFNKAEISELGMEDDLKYELAELDFLRYKVAEMQQLIYAKETMLAEVFGLTPEKTYIHKCKGKGPKHGLGCHPPPPPPPGRHHKTHGIRPPPPPPPPPHHGEHHHGVGHMIKVVVVPLLFIAILAATFRRCVRCRKSFMERRRARIAKREARKAACKAFFKRLSLCRLPCRRRGGGGDAEPEKEPMLNDNDSDTTMEDEIASCKLAADVVGDMVAAEEGRARKAAAASERSERTTENGVAASPRRSTDVFGLYVQSDDVPPAYNDSVSEGSSSVVTDGIRRGTSRYTPSSAGSQDSWEEVDHMKE